MDRQSGDISNSKGFADKVLRVLSIFFRSFRPRRSSKTSRPGLSFLLGLAGTAIVLAAHLASLDRRAELHAFDLRLQYAASRAVPENILHVDIDDASLDELGRWPWPRETLAGIVEVLGECGAKAIVLDIILPEPQKIRYVDAAGEVYSRYDSALVRQAPPVPVFDDAILTRTIRKTPNVFLPMHIDSAAADSPQSEIDSRMAVLLHAPRVPVNFSTVIADLRANAVADVNETEFAARAYLRRRAVLAVERFGMPPSRAGELNLRGGEIVPPLVPFARVMDGCGYVTFQPDEDGIVRRIPLLARSGELIYPQFALAVAGNSLASRGGGKVEISAAASTITLSCPDGTTRVIPVDKNGGMLINWSRGTWLDSAGRPGRIHISAAAVAAVRQQRRRLESNRNLMRLTQLTLAQGRCDELEKLFAKADELYHKRIAAQRGRYVAMLYDPANIPPPPADIIAAEARIEGHIEKTAAAFRKELDEFYLAKRPSDPQAGAQYDKLVALRDRLDRIRLANAKIKRDVADYKARLRKEITGKICIIGSTSTGAADFVPTPLWTRTPGVVVHSNIIRAILADDFLRVAPAAFDILVILAAGALVALLAARLPVFPAAVASILLAGGYTAFNAMVVFAIWKVWLVAVAPLAAMLASFLVVTAYRQFTEERAKRKIRTMFAHALSPTLVDRLLEDPSLAELGGRNRMLSCLFSDIVGFTPLSGRLGPEKTVRLLNRYFDCVTDVIQGRWGGYLNKFLGDGVFAFFGAPVAQADHPNRAVRSAVDYHIEVAKLNETLAREFGDESRLAVRIGVTTNEAMVGNCGSSERMDYTAIGECVNLASRLEAANKYFGTGILVDESSWQRCDSDGLSARLLGTVRIVGIAEPVRILEILGYAERIPAEKRQAMDDFATAIEYFAERNFQAAAELLTQIGQTLPDDRPTQIYLELCKQATACPPGEEFHCPNINSSGVVRIEL